MGKFNQSLLSLACKEQAHAALGNVHKRKTNKTKKKKRKERKKKKETLEADLKVCVVLVFTYQDMK